MRIDAHQHFWSYNKSMDWITPEMSVIQKDFTPVELEVLLSENEMDGCVTVQVDQTDEETKSLLAFGDQFDFIKGVVGWIDICAENISDKLSVYSAYKKLKGFRHILQAEEPAFMLQPAFIKGVKELGRQGFTYDILVFPKHLDAVLQLLETCPNQKFIIDHIAKPDIKNRKFDNWESNMKKIAQYPNVYCKLSGMVTEADWKLWKQEDMLPYLDTVSAAFGTNRLLFGSDWPVCLVAASYRQTLSIIKDYFSVDEHEKVLGKNAVEFYNLV